MNHRVARRGTPARDFQHAFAWSSLHFTNIATDLGAHSLVGFGVEAQLPSRHPPQPVRDVPGVLDSPIENENLNLLLSCYAPAIGMSVPSQILRLAQR